MDLWVTQRGDDPVRFLLIVIIMIYFGSFHLYLPVHPAVQEETRTTKLGHESRSIDEPFLGLEGGAVWTTPCLHTLSSLINSYVPYFLLPHVQDKKKELSCNILSL